jgi:eukaryotic-like serine/threonine-protein kinase
MAGETVLNNRYELVAQQGSGGMSVIYKATDRSLGRTVAIKILRPSLTQDPAFLGKFQQEARSVAKMAHPNIVTVHDVGSDGPTHYIVMEMIEGSDLKKVIKTQGALPFPKALNYAIKICDGLGYAHRSRLVHADVKPQNILINQDDVIKITDFGIAQAYTDTMPQTRAEVVWGSPHYFAPEQAKGEKPSPASDVYSIGIVMFEMFTGRLPFVGASQRELAMAHIQAEIPRAKDVNPSVPEEISNIIAKVMSKRPNDRFNHADQLGHILQGVQDRTRNSSANTVPGRSAPPTIMGSNRVPSQQPRPAAPPPVSKDVTYKHSAAPDAPQPRTQPSKSHIAPPNPFVDNIARPNGQHIPPQPNPIVNPDTGRFNPGPSGGYTGRFAPHQERQQEGLDFVTITLVFFALVAVGGLVLLYLFGVFPALA